MNDHAEHEARLRELAERYDEAAHDLEVARLALIAEAKAANADGMTMYRIAKIVGVTQPAVKKWITESHHGLGGLSLVASLLLG